MEKFFINDLNNFVSVYFTLDTDRRDLWIISDEYALGFDRNLSLMDSAKPSMLVDVPRVTLAKTESKAKIYSEKLS